jgi:hypothetical protein
MAEEAVVEMAEVEVMAVEEEEAMVEDAVDSASCL